MLERAFEGAVAPVLAGAGITVSGSAPYDLRVHDPRVYREAALGGSLGLGESYMRGDWDADELDVFFAKLLRPRHDHAGRTLPNLFLKLQGRFLNLQTLMRSRQVGRQHYDLGNVIESMLDRDFRLYSCAYWGRGAKTLEEAQRDKVRLIAEKLKLEPGMAVLDVGCGYGGLAAALARDYGVTVTGITISEDQARRSKKLCEGLPVDIRVLDYRKLADALPGARFDRVVSVGMFEHVGEKNYRAYFSAVAGMLKDDGLFLLHTIYGDEGGADPWMNRYIFPGGYIPSTRQIEAAREGIFHVAEDIHNFGPDYDRTLGEWRTRFRAAWPALEAEYAAREGGRFYRMWDYYLSVCMGGFRARRLQVGQYVLSKNGIPGGYASVR
ncbi:MAG: cyclopropane fatty acyl phospholipid synthase [Patescibacteria group bacterium]|nr:cyclopropane fatty acyl phospholipid synthase [Patescibacteria group bacterium]MDE1965878.1 cyclopropane fatty acyl phospholipid synthase [Patescibacteria group bacterium]